MSGIFEEKILFAKLARKNRKAFDDFYCLYADRIYQYIFYKVNSKEDAEDLTSAFFLKVWGLAQEGRIDEPKTFKAFIYTVARNIVIDHYRKLNQKKTVSLDVQIGRELNSEKPTAKDFLPDENSDSQEGAAKIMELDRIKEKLFDLKDEYREVIVLKYIDDLSPKEISAVLGKPKGHVNVLAHRAVKALRDLVERNQSPISNSNT